MDNKYYTPELEEFHVGFECETKAIDKRPGIIFSDISLYEWRKHKIVEEDFGNHNLCMGVINNIVNGDNEFRVKYLDKEDIESLGFNNNDIRLKDHIKPKTHLFKILKDNTIYTINWYWDMLREERENLIRIFIGDLHNYPYTEIFRGEIKNKSELKKLLTQLGIK